MALIEEGSYWGQLLTAVCGKEGEKETPVMRITFEITHRASGDGWEEIDPFTRDVKVWLSDAAWEMAERRLDAIGFNGDFVNPQFDQVLSAEGTELVCTHSQGRDRAFEDWSLAAWEGSQAKPLDKNTLRLLNARWKTKQSASRPAQGKPSGPPRREEPKPDLSEPRDEEIPMGSPVQDAHPDNPGEGGSGEPEDVPDEEIPW